MKKLVCALLAVLLLGFAAAYADGPLAGLAIAKKLPPLEATGAYDGQSLKVNIHELDGDVTEQMANDFEALARTDDDALGSVALEKFNKEILEAPEFVNFTDPKEPCRPWILARTEGQKAAATWPEVRIVAESYPVVVTLKLEDPDDILALLLYENTEDEWYVPEEIEPYPLEDGTLAIDFELLAPSHITVLIPMGEVPSPERLF